MFLFFKILETLILPPGIFILILAVIGLLLLRKGMFRISLGIMLTGFLLWSLSIYPVAHFLMHGLENDFPIPKKIKGDVIILLGAGLRNDVADLTGTGFPDGDMLGRLVTAARLYRKHKLPIIIASGQVYREGQPGAPVDRRILIDLGVAPEHILIDVKSRNTYENAIYSAEICRQHGYRNPILLTAAYHLKRARMAFTAVGLPAKPFPAYRNTPDNPKFFWRSYLPSHGAFYQSCIAIREYLGILYYSVRY